MYQGCSVFTAGDYYNAPVTSSAADPSSAAMIAAAASVDHSSMYDSSGYEAINLATNATSTFTIPPKAGVNYQVEMAYIDPVPWQNGFYIENGGDRHGLVLNTQTCTLYEMYQTTFSSGALAAYTGMKWNLTQPFVQVIQQFGQMWPSAMASGLSLFAGAVKSDELQAGVINHALNFDAVAHSLSDGGFVAPASNAETYTFSGSGSPTLPMGAHLRLHASFTLGCITAGTCPQTAAIVTALKSYGAYVADSGCCDTLWFVQGPTGAWNHSDLSNLGGIRITDFDVLALPARQCKASLCS